MLTIKPEQQSQSGPDSLARYVQGRQGRIHFDVPDALLPDFVVEAYNATIQGRHERAAELLNAEHLALVDRNLQQRVPGSLLASLFVAIVQQRLGQLEAALERYQIIDRQETHPLVVNELAQLYTQLGWPSRALAYRGRALAVDPDDAGIAASYAVDHILNGQFETGIHMLEEQLRRGTITDGGHSLLLWFLHYLPGMDRQRAYALHQQWGHRHAPTRLAKTEHRNVPDPERKIRIGYLSADFYSHAVAYAFDAMLDGHDRSAFEIYGYGSVQTPDKVTQYLRAKFDTYRPVYGLEDSVVAKTIEHDGIDILVAMAGHTEGHRLKVLAYKPAPIQVDWGGINTTGMTQVDYRFTDHWLDPPGSQVWYLEELAYLEGGMSGFSTPQGAAPIGELPALREGPITFGSFNVHMKINPPVIALWSQVLQACPDARLLLKFKVGSDDAVTGRFLEEFARHGIGADRVKIHTWCSHEEHWDLYNQVDIALDTFPFNGCITTLESLWMGVPVVSLSGPMWVNRLGLSLMANIGFEKFVAETPEQYIAKARALAANLDSLNILRQSMRERMLKSPLCRPGRYARDLEKEYRRMWRKWCNSH